MKLSTRARYALRMMLDLAKHGGEEVPVSLSAVAKRAGLSRGYLEQLAHSLRSRQLIRGFCGKKGGYCLTRAPSTMTLREIIEATIGPVNILECLADPCACPRMELCECRPVYALINLKIVRVLEQFTLADMLEPTWSASVQHQLRDLEEEGEGRCGRARNGNAAPGRRHLAVAAKLGEER